MRACFRIARLVGNDDGCYNSGNENETDVTTIESYLMQTPLTLEVCFKAKEDTAIVVSIA